MVVILEINNKMKMMMKLFMIQIKKGLVLKQEIKLI
jgi:hypothetical protein